MASAEAATPGVSIFAEELAEEIEYQKALLLSLDDTIIGLEQAEIEYKTLIRSSKETQGSEAGATQHNGNEFEPSQ